MSKITPILDNILLRSLETGTDEEVIGGIVIPESRKSEFEVRKYVVIAVSASGLANGNETEFSIKPGDLVITNKYGGTAIEHDGVQYKLAKQKDIIAVIEVELVSDLGLAE